jgi:hypothetical protein
MSSAMSRLSRSTWGTSPWPRCAGPALDDRGLAHAGLADQHRVVLGPPAEHLHATADLLVAPDHRVNLAATGQVHQVPPVALEGLISGFGIFRIDGGPAAHLLKGRQQRVALRPHERQRIAGERFHRRQR